MTEPTEPFFERFADPIDLSTGEPFTVAHLEHPAALVMGGEVLLVLPEADTPARELQDYKIISLSGLVRHIKGVEAQHQEFEIDFNQDDFLGAVRLVDRTFEDEHDLPNGMMILRHGERAMIGRSVTPQLDLPDHVSRFHADLANGDQGVTIVDTDSTNGTLLYLSPEDASREIPDIVTGPEISEELRDKLHRVFSELTDEDGNFDYADDRLIITGGDVEYGDNGETATEIVIYKAVDFPQLDVNDDYMLKKLTIDPQVGGIKVFDFPKTGKNPSISKVTRTTQINEAQAQQLLAISEVIKSK